MAQAYKRRSLLEGTWGPALAEHGLEQLGPIRARIVGKWDTGSNLFKSVIDQTSTMYDEPPVQQSTDKASLRVLEEHFDLGGWWGMARDHQKLVKACHESLVYVGWDDEMSHCTFELVTPDICYLEAAKTNRSRPVTVWWARQREIPGKPGELAWFWDRWSIEGGQGSYTIWSGDRTREMTTSWVTPEKWMGDAYPYRDEQGRALLPFALYHAQGAGRGLWSPICLNDEVIFGTYQVGLFRTAAAHGFLKASWAQRVILNGRVRGGSVEQVGQGSTGQGGGPTIRTLTPDPTRVLVVEGEQASIDEWGSPLDLEKVRVFCRDYENGLAVHFGLPPSDVVIESMNPQSGASLTVSQAGKRRIAARDRLGFGLGDRQLVVIVAAVSRARGRSCSAEGYRMRYRGVQLTGAERKEALEYVSKELELGLADRALAYMELHPGTDLEDALADLRDIDKRRMMDADMAAALAPPPPEIDPGADQGEDEDPEEDPEAP